MGSGYHQTSKNEIEKKKKKKKSYLRRMRKRLKIHLVRYSELFSKWTKKEQIDQKTRIVITMRKTLHLRNDIGRLYVFRKEGGRGVVSIEYCMHASIQDFEVYIKKSKERLIKATTYIIGEIRRYRKNDNEKLGNRNGEKLFRYFKRLTGEIAH